MGGYHLILRILLISRVISETFSQEEKSAYFRRATGNAFKLDNHWFLETETGSIFNCASLCLRNEQCVSWNFSRKERVCQLNNGTASDFPADVTLHDRFWYFERQEEGEKSVQTWRTTTIHSEPQASIEQITIETPTQKVGIPSLSQGVATKTTLTAAKETAGPTSTSATTGTSGVSAVQTTRGGTTTSEPTKDELTTNRATVIATQDGTSTRLVTNLEPTTKTQTTGITSQPSSVSAVQTTRGGTTTSEPTKDELTTDRATVIVTQDATSTRHVTILEPTTKIQTTSITSQPSSVSQTIHVKTTEATTTAESPTTSIATTLLTTPEDTTVRQTTTWEDTTVVTTTDKVTTTQVRTTTQPTTRAESTTPLPYVLRRECYLYWIYAIALPVNEILVIQNGLGRFPVYCDQTTHGGGWTVIQRRVDNSVSFDRGWQEYKDGFGDLNFNFWLGLDKIASICPSDCEIIFVMTDQGNVERFAKYNGFGVTGTDYSMITAGYISGAAGDSFVVATPVPFSTNDMDNDGSATDCANLQKGGWWYTNCGRSSPNGIHYGSSDYLHSDGIIWQSWQGATYSMQKIEIRVRNPTL